MQLGEVILLGIALSMDAFAVSAVSAMTVKNIRQKEMLLLAAAFGVFQGLMPLGGYLAGHVCVGAAGYWSGQLANLLACALLCLVGGKMLTDSLLHPTEAIVCLTPQLVLLQAVATSIDALAVGVGLAAAGLNQPSAVGLNIWQAAAIIAACTFGLCLLAVQLGRFCGARLARHAGKAGMAGGLILIGIGLKMLV